MDCECPNCHFISDVSECLPETAAETNPFECEGCGAKFNLGWYAEPVLTPPEGE